MEAKSLALVILLDLENTLVTRNYEELAATTLLVITEKLKAMTPPELAELGISALPMGLVTTDEKEAESYRAKYKATFVQEHRMLKEHPMMDCAISLNQLLPSLLVSKNILELVAPSKASAKLGTFGESVARDPRCLSIGYALMNEAKSTLEQLCKAQDKGSRCYRFALCSTTPLEVVEAVLKACGMAQLFDRIICHDVPSSVRAQSQLWEQARAAYAGLKDYQLCVIGDSLEADMIPARQLSLRTVWTDCEPWSYACNNNAIKASQACLAVDLAFTDYLQLPALLAILREDAVWLSKQDSTIQSNYRSKTIRKVPLPSERRLKVAYYFTKRKTKEMAKKCVIVSNDRLIFFPLQLDAALVPQGPFHALLHKSSEPLSEEFVLHKATRYSYLQEYTEAQAKTMVTVDPLEKVKVTLFRTVSNGALAAAFALPQLQSIMSQFGIRTCVPYYKVIKNVNSEETLETIQNDIAAKKCNYAFLIKLAESCEAAGAHTLAIVMNDVGMRQALELPTYKGHDLIVQQLVKHSATIYKLYSLGEEYFTYHTKKSLPTNLPITDMALFDSQKPFPKEWFSGQEQVIDKLNKDYVFRITKALIDVLDITMLGLDYIIEEGSGDYYLIDLNYFSSFRHETDLNEKMTQHILKMYQKKIGPLPFP